MMLGLGASGAFYGIEITATLVGHIAFGALYGFVGVCIAVPLAFAVNVTRSWI
jgi:predicted PurR-regulated permease PerM